MVWRRRLLVPIVAVAATIVLVVVVWMVVRDGDDPNEQRAITDSEPGVSHVHGLGINPADGSLIVATHFGSFRIGRGGGKAERIGGSYQDTMGFTVVGADRFLGSGHPDVPGLRKGQPTQLGLIESTDAGQTWSILSLGGAADFHGLAYAHDQVYGWDAGTGRFMVSTDRREWESRSTVDLYGFAVDPDNGDHIIGGRPDGLLPGGLTESNDGGRTWFEAEGPDLVVVTWDAEEGLWGAERGGAVWHHTGSEWEQVSEVPGGVQAFLATDDALYAAVHDANDVTAIYKSVDRGDTWDLLYRDSEQ